MSVPMTNDTLVGENPGQVRRLRAILEDLDDVGRSVAARDLHDAQPVPMEIEAEGFRVDRERVARV